jgi:integrase
MEKFDAMIRDVKEKKNSSEYIQKLHEIRTGKRIDSIPLEKFADEWDKSARKRTGTPRYVKEMHSLFGRFVKFVKKEYKDAETLADVTPAIAEAFMAGEKARGVSGRTFNAALILLRSAFKVLSQKANISRNPFAGIITADEKTTHRKPFTQDELQAILLAADKDPFIRPVIITGMCTAMRRGDCCLLRWEDVDLKERFVRVKTAKTGETVEIPMFPILHKELAAIAPYPGPTKGMTGRKGYCFPEQAKMYLKNAHGITYRVKQLLEAAGFFDVKEDDKEQEEKDKEKEKDTAIVDVRPLLPADELLTRGLKVLAEIPDNAMDATKREVMTDVFKAYVGGGKLPAIAEKLGHSKSTLSLYLHEIERRSGLRVLRVTSKNRAVKRLGDLSAARKVGLRRGSVRDFHSFRVTWITLALAAGVPMELVTRVTGHQSVDVVLKHYFRPGREDFRQAIESAMPKLLMQASQPENEPKKPGELLEEALKGLEALPGPTGKAGTVWKQEQARIVALIVQARELAKDRAAKS